MKKLNETPERLLIQVDQEQAKYNKETMNKIFSQIKELKEMFDEIEITFNQSNFVKTVRDGCKWIENELLNKLIQNNYKGLPEKIIESIVPELQFKNFLTPIETLVRKLKEHLTWIGLLEDQIPFNEKAYPIITNELEQILDEKSKKYISGIDEIEIFHTMEKFAAICNKLEALLYRYKFPLMITLYTNPESQVPFAETVHSFYPFFVTNYDSLETNGCATLDINTEFFEDIRRIAEANAFTEEMRRAMPKLQSDKPFRSDVPGYDVSATAIRLPKTVGKLLGEYKANPDKERSRKGRWTGFKD